MPLLKSLLLYWYEIHYCYVTVVFIFTIRDELKRHYTLGEYWVEVEMEDLASFDEDLSDCLYKLPTENLPLVGHHCIPSLDQNNHEISPCPIFTILISFLAGGSRKGGSR